MRFYGLDIREYLVGRRDPRQALRLVRMLPEESVFMAMLRAEPKTGEKSKTDPWREFYGWTRTQALLADLWDMQSAVNTRKGAKRQLWPRPKQR